ncbi:MAG: ROK family protein [Solirubrobacterales bacterium]
MSASTSQSTTRKVIGVDLGGTKLLAGVIDEQLEVYGRTHSGSAGLSQDDIVEAVVAAVAELREFDPDIEAVGFGIPCLIDQRSGVAVMAVNLPIQDFAFRDTMRKKLGLPVFMDNDANVATLVEQRFGAARGGRDVVGLTIGTGIGGGIVLDGQIYRGSVGAGGELGHMVIDEDGPPCQGQCPNRGCLEALASGTAIGREGAIAGGEEPESALGRAVEDGLEITGEMVTDMALSGDEVARMVLGHIGSKLGVGLASISNIFNPDYIVVGGGAMAAGELLLEPARAELAVRGLRPNRDLVQVVGAKFGAEAGMLGAAVLAFDELDSGGAG